MRKLVIIFYILSLYTGCIAQDRLWISEKSSIILRDDLQGFQKVNDSTWRMIDMDKPCEEGENVIIIDGVATFSSMPCFRDYLLSQPNKIIVWGKLLIGTIDTTIVDNWEIAKIKYYGSRWRGSMVMGIPGDGCKCSFSDQIGDSAVFDFTGTGIQLWGEKNPHENTADIYLDGIKVATANQYQDTEGGNTQVLMYKNENLAYGPHSIKVVVTGKDEVATGDYFVIHNFRVLDDRSLGYTSPTVETCVPDTIYVLKPYPVYDTIPSDTIRETKHFYYIPKATLIQGEIMWDWEVVEDTY